MAWLSKDYCKSLEVSGDRNAAPKSPVLSKPVFVCVFVLKQKLFGAISSSGVAYHSSSENNGAEGPVPNYTV